MQDAIPSLPIPSLDPRIKQIDRNIVRTYRGEGRHGLGEDAKIKVVGYTVAFIGGLIVCYLLLSLGVVDKVDGIPSTQEEPILSLPTYLSFLSVLMTAITAVLTAVAIGIGLIAAYTSKSSRLKLAQPLKK